MYLVIVFLFVGYIPLSILYKDQLILFLKLKLEFLLL